MERRGAGRGTAGTAALRTWSPRLSARSRVEHLAIEGSPLPTPCRREVSMRSVPSSRCRPPRHRAHPSPAPVELQAVARLVDEVAVDEPDHLLVHVLDEPGPDLVLGTKPFDRSVHPFTMLAGFTAPTEWAAFGLRIHGRIRRLDEPGAAPVASRTTFLVHRDGSEASVLRQGDTAEDLPGPAIGTIPDLCRRVLGLPTPPPPAPTTRPLWITIWLDRIMTAWSDPAHRSQLSSCWPQVAAMHPAQGEPGPPGVDPADLVAVASAHTDRWPWARLRAEAQPLALPDGPLPPDVAAWMDDGFYARWVLGAFPAAEDLADDLLSLLQDPVRSQLRTTLIALLTSPG